MSYPIHEEKFNRGFTDDELKSVLDRFLSERAAKAQKVLILPPDFTRYHSRAGDISAYLYHQLKDRAVVHFLPALGTHEPMSSEHLEKMFGSDIPKDLFHGHDWRNDVKRYGEIEAERIGELSEGKLACSMEVAVNRRLEEGNYDLIVSVGQVVPHEVIGMANYTKNILVGVGGSDTISKSHFLGAVYGMERIMGRVDTPVRRALNEGFDRFLRHLPIEFILTVLGKVDGAPSLQGLYCGNGHETYEAAARLSQKLNIDLLEEPIHKAVVYLDPEEFASTWLGDKAIYRLRMAIADGGQLVVLAPGLRGFGEDKEIDRLIRKHGYRTSEETLRAVEEDPELGENLSAAAHLIHGSSEGRFSVVYCPGPGVSREEIEGVGYEYGNYEEMAAQYQLGELKDGWNDLSSGERIFYVSNPALGLWSTRQRFEG